MKTFFHQTLIYWTLFLYYLSTFSHSYVLIYHTENTPLTQYYDCIYYTDSGRRDIIQSVKYCRQFNVNQRLERDFNSSCHNGGQLWPFEKLARLNVTAADVLQWSSSVEQTNQYAKYLLNSSSVIKNRYLCNCTNPASFGKFCEYEFYSASTVFDDAIVTQFEARRQANLSDESIYVGSQLHNNRPCYVTWNCYSGLMCLDWRFICDGNDDRSEFVSCS